MLSSIRLVRHAPLPLCLLVFIHLFLTLFTNYFLLYIPLSMLLNIVLAGLFCAICEIDLGYDGHLKHLFAGFRRDRIWRIFSVTAMTICLYFLAIGIGIALLNEENKHALNQLVTLATQATVVGKQAEITQVNKVLAQLNNGRFALSMATVVLLVFVIKVAKSLVLPLILFNALPGLRALSVSFIATLKNASAYLVFSAALFALECFAFIILVTISFVVTSLFHSFPSGLIGLSLLLLLSIAMFTIVQTIFFTGIYFSWKSIALPTSQADDPLAPKNIFMA